MSTALAEAPTALPLTIHIATEAGAPVVDAAFVERQVARANAIFAPHGVAFRAEDATPLRGHAAMATRQDRDALGALVRDGTINCFFVKSLLDVDEPGRVRRGVHWRSTTHPPAHYVIVSSISFDDVLAHELGHFLGNHRHSDTPGNLMSYSRTDALPSLDAAQIKRLHRHLRRYLRRGELVELSPGLPESGPRKAQAVPSRDGSAPPKPVKQ